ncbi:Hypothetical predicted protein [Paramuricea clavata]|uniref:Uncharacterized protein n=1 Tax=Paramuricea clavata TaxID=317549 RepID=A0A6S7G8D5_PARCT|nr:Hypothetical predicted protein [Paramuricea clavata]
MLRSFEETEKLNTKPKVDQVMKAEFPSQTMTCYGSGRRRHLVRECPVKERTSRAELRIAQDSGELTLENGTIVEIEEHGRLYYLTSIGSHEKDSVSEVEILGHCNFEDITKLQGVVMGKNSQVKLNHLS